jgi:elongation factor G
VLEPISDVEVTIPVSHQGDVMGDLSARRGHILGTEPGDTADEVVVRALVPSSELGRYAIDLRSMTAGQGRYAVSHHSYQPMPHDLVSKLATA